MILGKELADGALALRILRDAQDGAPDAVREALSLAEKAVLTACPREDRIALMDLTDKATVGRERCEWGMIQPGVRLGRGGAGSDERPAPVTASIPPAPIVNSADAAGLIVESYVRIAERLNSNLDQFSRELDEMVRRRVRDAPDARWIFSQPPGPALESFLRRTEALLAAMHDAAVSALHTHLMEVENSLGKSAIVAAIGGPGKGNAFEARCWRQYIDRQNQMHSFDAHEVSLAVSSHFVSFLAEAAELFAGHDPVDEGAES